MAGVKKVLYTGYKASDLKRISDLTDSVFHVLDIYHKHAIEAVYPEAEVVCSAHLPEGDWEKVCFRTGPMLMSGELTLDIMQECHRLGCKVELDYVGKERDRNNLLEKFKPRNNRERSFKSVWQASVPKGPKLDFISYPGCFCHRRLDEGGLSLAEVVSKELSEKNQDKPIQLIDMGCGCGLVGFLIKSVLPSVELTMVDSHTRAIEATIENSKNLSMDVRSVLSDNGVNDNAVFDVFVGNPPYYSDYRIADVFLQTAKNSLKDGGVCYTVCKAVEGLEAVHRKYFSNVTVINRRSYAILKSVK